jgi:pimeloyl-ACP methyl ester carboxylesterase
MTAPVRAWGDPSAPTLVFWPGFLATDAIAAEIGPALAARGWRFLAVNPLAASDHWEVPTLADAVVGLAPERFVMAGHSWGAQVGTYVAQKHPKRLRALVLLDGAFVDEGELDPGWDEEAHIRQVLDSYSSFGFENWSEFETFARANARRPPDILIDAHREWLVERNGRLAPPHTPEVVAAIARGMIASPSRATYPALAGSDIPIVLLRASEPRDEQERRKPFDERFAREVPHAEIITVPDAGHELLWDAGPSVADIVADWLERNAQ